MSNDLEITDTEMQIGRTLDLASDEMSNTQEVLSGAAVMHIERALRYSFREMRYNQELLTAEMMQNGRALQLASDEMRNNEEVIIPFVTQNGTSLTYVA